MPEYTHSCICSSCVCLRVKSSEQLEVYVNACILIGIVMTL